MPVVRKKAASRKPAPAKRTAALASTPERTKEALAWLERHGTKKTRDGMSRFGIATADRVLGVTVRDIRKLAKELGTDHDLAVALWNTGIYEARMLTSFVGDVEKLTTAQMDEWCRACDNWAVIDTLCFVLFDRAPGAFGAVSRWAKSREEFVKRGAFALLASLALHGRGEGDAPYLRLIPLIERAATDERNFVKKAVNWALRAVGGRSSTLHVECLAVAERLAASNDATARWVGKDAAKELRGAATLKRLSRKKKA